MAVLGAEKVASLKASTNRKADIAAAMQDLQKESGYLFGDDETPPPFSAGAGNGGAVGGDNPFSFNFGGIRPKETGK